MANKNKNNDQPTTDADAADIFDQSVTTVDPTATDADAKHDDQPAATDAAFDKAVNDQSLGDALATAGDDRGLHAGTDHGAIEPAEAGRNVPVDVETGTPFFMDLTTGTEIELIPIGVRAVVSCTAAEAVLSAAGNPMINLRVKIERVVKAPDMAKSATFRNRAIRDRIMFIPPNDVTGSRGTLWRAKQAYDAFGIEWPKLQFRTQREAMDRFAQDAESFVGSVAEIIVGQDDGTNGGKKTPEINPETGEAYPPKNTIAQYWKYNPAPAAATSDEDLPF